MKKQFISKVLAVVMAFSLVGMTTQASAATTETQTVAQTSETENQYPLTVDVKISGNCKVNHTLEATFNISGKEKEREINLFILKDGQRVAEKTYEYGNWSCPTFFWTPREAGKYTLYAEVKNHASERKTITKDFTVEESNQEISAPANLRYEVTDYGKSARIMWDPSIAKNCKITTYYLIVDGRAERFPSYQQYYDMELDDQMHSAYVVAIQQDGADVTESLQSNTIIIPAAK